MAYGSNTINSATPGNDFHTAIAALFVSAGFTLVDSGNLAAGAPSQYEVYKSAAGGNLAEQDWYVAVCWKATGSETYVKIIAGLTYDVGTHTLGYIPGAMSQVGPNPSTNPPMTSLYAQPGGDLWGSQVIPNVSLTQAYDLSSFGNATKWGIFGATTTAGLSMYPPSSAWGYWVSIQPDAVAIGTVGCTGPQTSWGAWTTSPTLFPDYAALVDGVAPHPLCSSSGVSNLVLPPSTAGQVLLASASYEGVRGPTLPTTVDHWYPAYAMRPRLILSELLGSNNYGTNQNFKAAFGGYSGQSAGAPEPGYLPITDALDIYAVVGGGIGDTVTIDSATYVIIPVPDTGQLGPDTGAKFSLAAKTV